MDRAERRSPLSRTHARFRRRRIHPEIQNFTILTTLNPSTALAMPPTAIEGDDPNVSTDSNSESDDSAVVDFLYSSVQTDIMLDGNDIPQIDVDQLILLQNMPPLPIEYRYRLPALPLKTRRTPSIALALDLDETLVHCSLEYFPNASHTFSVEFQNDRYQVYVRIRPFLYEFLEQVCDSFEIILFTASKKVYADKLLDILDPKRRYFRHRLFREHCILINGNYVKDLGILGRDPARTIIIDNSPQAFAYHLDNGIPIQSYFDGETDDELIQLVPFLQSLRYVNDVRPFIRDRFKMRDIVGPISDGNLLDLTDVAADLL
uniref:FCP1 homology domain-containing protein n=1 Tax=Panagrellus redivivus TaxID=6233 RepID=A0A7E4UZZ1_PANRE